MPTSSNDDGNVIVFFSPCMLNLMANMVSHIKRVARPNKPFRIASKYSDEVSSSSRVGYVPPFSLSHTNTRTHTNTHTHICSFLSFSCTETRHRYVCEVPLRRPHQKRALERFSGYVGHYRSSFYATFYRVIFVSRRPPFRRRYVDVKIVIADRRPLHAEKSRVHVAAVREVLQKTRRRRWESHNVFSFSLLRK